MPIIAHQNQIIGQATNAEALVKDTVGWTGKNLLKNTATTQTKNGVTLTVNDNKSITINGTTTGITSFELDATDNIPIGDYIFSKGDNILPEGTNIYINSYLDNVYVKQLVALTGNTKEKQFTVDYDGYDELRIATYANSSGKTYNNVTLYPMIRRADIIDDTYEPYHESVEVMYEEEIHGVNLLMNTAVTQTKNGVTLTVNDNKSITINGTATADVYFNLDYINNSDTTSRDITNLVGETLIASISKIDVGIRLNVGYFKSDGYVDIISGLGSIYTSKAFVYPEDALRTKNFLHIPSGLTLNNVIVYPMIRKADIEDSTYRPYNPQAIQNQLNAQGVLGAKNWMPSLSAKTASGITWAINDDGSATMNGTATAGEANSVTVDATPYIGHAFILSGCISGGALNKYSVDIEELDNNNTQLAMYHDYGDGVTIPTIPSTVKKIRFRIYVASGQTFSNVVFKPMLRLASDPDDTYQPYAMTNKELTEAVEYHKGDTYEININASDTCVFIGTVTTSTTEIRFTIPLPKSIGKDIANHDAITVNVTNATMTVRKSPNGYLYPNGTALSDFNVTARVGYSNFLNVIIKKSDESAFDIDNNSIVMPSLNGSWKFTF